MGQVATSPNFWREGESFKTGSTEKKERLSAYVEWLLTPPAEREPKTKAALAEQLGVTPQTLRNYSKEPSLQRELAERARALARVDRLPEILQSLYDQATDKDNPRSVQAAGRYLDWLEKTSTIREAELDVQALPEEELVKLGLEILQRANEKGE